MTYPFESWSFTFTNQISNELDNNQWFYVTKCVGNLIKTGLDLVYTGCPKKMQKHTSRYFSVIKVIPSDRDIFFMQNKLCFIKIGSCVRDVHCKN